jgi:hypothetical protein
LIFVALARRGKGGLECGDAWARDVVCWRVGRVVKKDKRVHNRGGAQG